MSSRHSPERPLANRRRSFPACRRWFPCRRRPPAAPPRPRSGASWIRSRTGAPTEAHKNANQHKISHHAADALVVYGELVQIHLERTDVLVGGEAERERSEGREG